MFGIVPNTDRDMDRDTICPMTPSTQPSNTLRRSAPVALTTATIRNLKPGKMLADGAVRPGFGSLKARRRIAANDRTVTEFIFVYQHEGKTRTQTLGRFSSAEAEGHLTLVQARAEAARLQTTIKGGEDPLAQREIARQEAKIQQANAIAQVREADKNTLAALCDTYVASLRERKKDASAYDVENLFGNHVKAAFPDLAALPASAITPEHVSRILTRLVGPHVEHKKGRTALKLRSFLAAAFRLGLGAAIDPMAAAAASSFGLTANPAAAVPSTSMAQKFNRASARVLSIDELRTYLAYVAAHPSTLIRLGLMLQIATGGQRVQQLLRIEHAHIHAGETLTLFDPKGRRAQPRPHVLPIVPEVQEILGELATINHEGAFFHNRDAVVRPETLSEAVLQISDTMNHGGTASAPFRGGDIRRTVETILAERLGVSKDTRAQLLSHGLSGVQDAHYDKGLHLQAKTHALRRWNDFIADLAIGAVEESNVRQLHAMAA